MPSSRPPKINPAGTTYKGVYVYVADRVYTHRREIRVSKEYRSVMRIVGQYLEADYAVHYTEYRDDWGHLRVDVSCKP